MVVEDELGKEFKFEEKVQQYFEKLNSYIGKKVRIEWSWYGSPESTEGILRNIEEYRGISCDVKWGKKWIPFIGYGSAIREVTDENYNTLYENPFIPIDYDIRNQEKIEELVALCFGEKIANEIRNERIKYEKEFEIIKRKADEYARTQTQKYLEQGKNLVKENLLEEWEKYVRKNTQDGYYAKIVEASLRVMQALSEGKPPKEALKTTDRMGITIFMTTCMAQTVSYFHPRGEEFRKYWNGLFMSKEEAERAKGVANPACLIIEYK